jgi:histidinol-phosphate aminotransferase
VWPGAANFVLAHAPRGARLVDRLASRGIAVRPAHTFPGLTADHFRVAVRGAEDHERLARALREL